MNLPTELFHYAEKPIQLEPRLYLPNPDVFLQCDEGMKPWGLWISIEDFVEDQTWLTWCKAEDFHLQRLKCRHKITLKENANVLYMKTHKELIDFSLKYPANDPMDFTRHFKYPEQRPYVYRINWKKIKKEYDAIFIAPYLWEARHCMCAVWYYGWDCASGCIWNLDIIESIHHDPLPQPDLLQSHHELLQSQELQECQPPSVKQLMHQASLLL